MTTAKLIKSRPYPTRYLTEFTKSRKNLIRLPAQNSGQAIDMPMAVEAEAAPCFLSEARNALPGQEYSVFEITRLDWDKTTGLFSLNADISFPEACEEITLYADLLDTVTGTVVSSYETITVSSQKSCEYCIEHPFTNTFPEDPLSVIVYADWKTSSHSLHSAAILEELSKNIALTLNYLYPKKEDQCIEFPANHTALSSIDSAEPAVPGLLASSASPENIQIALYREPHQKADLDYLCKFGKFPDGQPYLGVPTAFTLIMNSSTTSFSTEKPVTVICSIAPLDQSKGGRVVVAAASSTVISETITIKASPKEIEVTALGPWQKEFPYGGNDKPYDFSYEISIDFFTVTQGQTRAYPTQYISSVREKSACLQRIPHVSIRWGCMVENTLVTMADGSQKPVQSIRISDQVACRDGSKQVVNIWYGMESSYYKITTDNGCTLSATRDHPVLMEDGSWKRINSLIPGDKLQTGNGSSSLAAIEVINENTSVYSLSLAEDQTVHAILTNGIYTGDFEVQNSRLSGDQREGL